MPTVSTLIDEVTPAIARLKAQLANKEPIMEELAWMAIEHVHDRYRGQGYSRRFGGGPQQKWEKTHDVTVKLRRIRHGVTDDIIWFDSGAAIRGISVINRTPNQRVIGWPIGKYKNDYPYMVDAGVPRTGGTIPGKTIRNKQLLYFTKAFANKWATQAVWRWWLAGIGVKVYQ